MTDNLKETTVKLSANELADWIENNAPYNQYETAKQSVIMLRQQAKEIEELNFVLKNLVLATNKKIDELEEALEDCTCQGGHSEAYLKAKGKL